MNAWSFVKRMFSRKSARQLKAPRCLYQASTVFYASSAIVNNMSNADSISIGANTHVRGEILTFAHGGQITIGDYCYIGEGTRIWSAKSITIGNRVLISHNVNIYDNDTHPIDDPAARHKQFRDIITTGHPTQIDLCEKPVVIEDDALVASACTILKGITIGRASVVGAGSVVTKDVPPYSLVAGNPARFIRKLNTPEDQP
jgi:acetyltransferase-like isoleucine patch superfamily enzyme